MDGFCLGGLVPLSGKILQAALRTCGLTLMKDRIHVETLGYAYEDYIDGLR